MANIDGDGFKPDPAVYDAMIDWKRRLERETPFYRQLFERVKVQSVLDVACGSGRHAEMFHSWGLSVEGADISPEMLDYCRTRCGPGVATRWVQRGFDQPADPPASFDAVICVGNSLAIAPDLPKVGEVLSAMIRSIRPGGALVVQVLNLWRFEEGPIVWQKCRRIPTDDGAGRILLKGIHRIGPRGIVEIASLSLAEDNPQHEFRTATILGIERDELLSRAREAGATECSTYGGYDESPYRRDQSEDLILVARRSLAAESM